MKEIETFYNVVNCEDVKIEIWVNGFWLGDIYYSLGKNILKRNYNDEVENVEIEGKNKIKIKALKELLKAYKKLNNSEYKTKQIEKINNNIGGLRNGKN